MSGAITAAVIAAGGAAYSANQQKKAAEKAAQQAGKPSDSWSENRPLFDPEGDIAGFLLNEQRRIYEGGPPDFSKMPGGGGGVGARGNEAMEIYRQIAERGLGANNTPGMQFAQGAIGDVWSGQGTGFEGYNPILNNLASELGGSSMDIPMGLLLGFLGENDRNYMGQVNGPGGGGEMSEAERRAQEYNNDPFRRPGDRRATAADFSGGGGGGGGGSYSFNYSGGGGGGVPPDTGAGSGTFQRELDKIFSDEANEEEIAAVLDSMQGDIERSAFQGMADLEARAQGSGRFGGDWHSARISDAKAEMAQEISKISAQLRYGDLEQRRQAKLRALEILNNRDVAAMADQTQRAGIASAAGSAAAGRSLSQQLAEMQNATSMRGQDLQAIMGMMQGEQFGLSSLLGMGERLSGDRMGALGLIPQFESLGLAGLDRAQGAAGGMAGLEQIDAAARARNASARQNAWLQQQGAEQNMLNDYMRTVLGLGSAYNVNHSVGTNPAAAAPYTQQANSINPWVAGLMAGIGSYAGSMGGGGYGSSYGGTVDATTGQGNANIAGLINWD